MNRLELREPREPVRAELPQLRCDQGRRRRRKENLAPVTRVGDSGDADDVETDVALVGEERGARVQADANPHLRVTRPRAVGKRALGVRGRGRRILRRVEGPEHLVATRIDLMSSVGTE